MFRFESSTYLYLLSVLPILVLIRFFTLNRQKKLLAKFGDTELLKHLMPDVSRWRPNIKFSLLITELALLIVMWARPQFGTRISEEKRSGIEVMIALDISNSMLAEDVTPSRLERSKMLIENLVDNFTNNKIGLVVFAGNSYVQLPITSDYVSAKMFLNSINPSMMATQGTDISSAITTSMNSFTQQQGIGKAIIVITDGENHEGGALESAKEAQEKGINIFVLGIGSSKGSPIPISGTDEYLRDNEGNVVMSALNENMCREIAKAGEGVYIHVENNTTAQESLNIELDKLSKKEIASQIYSDFDEQFQAIGIIALILLIIETCIGERKNPKLKNIRLFRNKVNNNTVLKFTLILIVLQVSSVYVNAQTDRQLVRSGNKQFRKGDHSDSEISYRKALDKNARNPQASYNLGNALFAQRKDSAAIKELENAVKLETSPLRKAQAFHNIGVICQSHQMFGEAIEAYKSSLRLNPNDDTSRYNLELCKRQQKQQNQNNQNKNNKDDNKDKDKEKDNKDKQQDKQQNKEKDKQKKQENNDQDKMDKETAEQLLKAAMQEEKNTQQRMKKAMQQPSNKKLLKNW